MDSVSWNITEIVKRNQDLLQIGFEGPSISSILQRAIYLPFETTFNNGDLVILGKRAKLAFFT